MLSKLVFFAVIAGVAYLVLFNKPRHHSVDELQRWFDRQLVEIHDRLEKDVELDQQGQYPHQGRHSLDKQGSITYHLLDKHFARFDLSEKNELTRDDIQATKGWRQLQDKANRLGYQLHLDEIKVDGDEVQSYEELDEYIDDINRYYTVTVSGW